MKTEFKHESKYQHDLKMMSDKNSADWNDLLDSAQRVQDQSCRKVSSPSLHQDSRMKKQSVLKFLLHPQVVGTVHILAFLSVTSNSTYPQQPKLTLQ